jgi:PPOX class probable F420-dependent enzyme
LWDGDSFLLYSKPNAPKVRNIRRSLTVALHLNTGADGDDIVIVNGQAEVLDDAPRVVDNPAYVAKYAEGIARIGMTPGSMGAAYSTGIRVRPNRLREH